MLCLPQPVKRLLSVRGTPHAIALGAALGLFVGFTPTVGVQMITVVFLGTLIGANRIIAVAMVWISNPLTMVPMYYGYYWVGTLILGTSRWTFDGFADHASALVSLNWFAALKSLGWDVGVPLVVGSLVTASGVASIAYPIVLALAARYRRVRFRHLTSRRASRRRRVAGTAPGGRQASGGAGAEAPAGGRQRGAESRPLDVRELAGGEGTPAGDDRTDGSRTDRAFMGPVARRRELPQ